MTDSPTPTTANSASAASPAAGAARWKRPLAISAGVVAAWGLGVGVGLPRLIQSQIATQGQAALGVPVQAQAVRLSPWSLALEIDGLAVGPAKAPWLAVAHARVRPSLESIWRMAPVIAEVQLDQPQVTLVRTGETTFNITPALERLRARPASPDTGEPARFAVANIAVKGGRFVFDDQVLAQRHTVDQLELGIPFLSNLPVFIDTQVEPLLKARIDGSALNLTGQTLPFQDGRRSTLTLNWQQVDVAHWLRAAQPFLPAAWGVSPQGGLLSTQLTLHFEQPAKAAPVVRLTGQASLERLGLSARQLPGLGQTTLGWQSLKVQGLDTQPLRQQALVGAVQLQGLTLTVRPATSQPRASASTPATPPASKTGEAAPAWQWQVGQVSVQASAVDVQTAALPWPRLSDLKAQVKGLSNQAKAAPATWSLAVNDDQGGQVQAQGTVQLPQARTELTLSLKDVSVPAWLKPMQAELDLPVELRQGTVSAQWPLQVQWAAQGPDTPAALTLMQGTVQLVDWQARTRNSRRTPLPLQAEQIDFQRLSLQGIDARVPLAGNTPPQARVADTLLEGFNTRIRQGDLKLALQQTRLQVRNASTDLRQAVQVALQARTPGQGSLNVQGDVRPQPLNARLKLDIRQVDLSPLQPLLAPHLNVVLASGRAQADGLLTLQMGATSVAQQPPSLKAGYQGMVGLRDLKLLDTVNDGTLLSWRQLALSRTQFDWQDDGQNAPQLRADLGQIQLADYFGRVIVNANGSLNLSQIVKQASQTEPTSLTTPQAPGAPAASAVSAASTTTAATAASAVTTAQAASTPARPAPVVDLRWQGITLAQGRIDFTDLFIKPNYSANLTRIGGTISAVAAQNPEPATVDIAGSVDDAAPLKISGRIHPLGPTLFTDIQASAKGVELTRLSPYAARYAGYNIDKGSLSMDVSYKVDGGKLAAENRIFLDQLTFGERNNSPDATHLPVQLAVALLKNSRGEIDINLPISGSINDPQFSVGGILWKVVVNLITKALTAPFSLLMGGGGEEMSFVAFAPGSAVLDEAARKRLDALGAKLADKGGLKLDATGWADADSDTEGLRDEHVRQLMRAAKAKATGQAVDDTEVAPAEEAQWLAAAYKTADIKKPRNLVGLAKTLPAAEM
ncbi:MAG: hypothetical protein RLZZ182_988, partial [Pseudomonadota bacterium]